MKKIIALTALTVAGLAFTTPANADDGPGVDAASNWNFSAASVCFQELATVPVGGVLDGSTVNHCTNGNVLNHTP
ncbi:hypothetical protein [Streptomyces justiciae]|uniref:Secreted protein n=1 Tax=Streptomyces justiciae TaxID=2780140 RepID=A0ABU3M7F0_9ACTN|nr:hypothetical protein [Streptomyces justiciae]MDT7846697.1 hypothetical protein [Streptomyces justiciae]